WIMTDVLEAAAATMLLSDPVDVEQPREGDPAGPPCPYCKLEDSDAVWSNAHWRVMVRQWSPLPGGMLLLSKAHVDTLSQMPPERQREFGPIAAWIEHAIMNLGRVARVHLYRWGDGRAHFHVHFVPRPLDFRSLVGGIYPFSRRASPTLVKNIWLRPRTRSE